MRHCCARCQWQARVIVVTAPKLLGDPVPIDYPSGYRYFYCGDVDGDGLPDVINCTGGMAFFKGLPANATNTITTPTGIVLRNAEACYVDASKPTEPMPRQPSKLEVRTLTPRGPKQRLILIRFTDLPQVAGLERAMLELTTDSKFERFPLQAPLGCAISCSTIRDDWDAEKATFTEAAPGNVHDCKAAVRWLRANAAAYGIDPTRIGALGGSAGAHLVALLGTTNGRQELEGNGGNPAQSSAVQAVCEFCAPVDLTRGAQPALRKKYPLLYECVEAYLGGPLEKRMELAKLVSPLRYVSPTSAPTLIIHGDADDIVSVEESIVFYDALKQAGVDATLHVAKGATHDLTWSTYGNQVVAFFRRTLTNKKERD